MAKIFPCTIYTRTQCEWQLIQWELGLQHLKQSASSKAQRELVALPFDPKSKILTLHLRHLSPIIKISV
jgi:hypothetical protein